MILLLSANALFWAYFWIDFGSRLVPYHGHTPGLDQAVPEYVWYGQAVPYYEDVQSAPYGLMKWVQQPVYAIVEFASWEIVETTGFPYRWGDETLLGVSVGGYQITATMLLSFFQWYGIGQGLTWLAKRRRRP